MFKCVSGTFNLFAHMIKGADTKCRMTTSASTKSSRKHSDYCSKRWYEITTMQLKARGQSTKEGSGANETQLRVFSHKLFEKLRFVCSQKQCERSAQCIAEPCPQEGKAVRACEHNILISQCDLKNSHGVRNPSSRCSWVAVAYSMYLHTRWGSLQV